MTKTEELIEAVKEMAKVCNLQNWEQISEEHGAIGAIRMIQDEYLWQIKGKRKCLKQLI